jgi:osmotically-inducible protein OsmY
VPPDPWFYSDYQLRMRVQRALATDRFLRVFNVHLLARQGVVILTGTANTWQDRERATLDAKAAGALTVLNRLRVTR